MLHLDSLISRLLSTSGFRAATFSKFVKTFLELTTVPSEGFLAELRSEDREVKDDCLFSRSSRTVGKEDEMEVTDGLVRRPFDPGETSRLEADEVLAEEEYLRSDLEDTDPILLESEFVSHIASSSPIVRPLLVGGLLAGIPLVGDFSGGSIALK